MRANIVAWMHGEETFLPRGIPEVDLQILKGDYWAPCDVSEDGDCICGRLVSCDIVV